MAVILDGKALSEKIRASVINDISALNRVPALATILVGEDPASQMYMRAKAKDCAQCGVENRSFTLPAETTQEELLALIDRLNNDDTVDGILVAMPFPKHIDSHAVIEAICPEKDVDGFNPVNVGRMASGRDAIVPCTPAGVMEFIREYDIPVDGKLCVVIGRSNVVGRPMAQLLIQANGTVICCNSHTADLPSLTRQADIIVACAGHAGLVTADMVKEGAVVIDVSINRNAEGKTVGDVCFDEVSEKASYITPVPGGCGPVTRAVLMKNLVEAAKKRG